MQPSECNQANATKRMQPSECNQVVSLSRVALEPGNLKSRFSRVSYHSCVLHYSNEGGLGEAKSCTAGPGSRRHLFAGIESYATTLCIDCPGLSGRENLHPHPVGSLRFRPSLGDSLLALRQPGTKTNDMRERPFVANISPLRSPWTRCYRRLVGHKRTARLRHDGERRNARAHLCRRATDACM